jgi:hypothetical protein
MKLTKESKTNLKKKKNNTKHLPQQDLGDKSTTESYKEEKDSDN